MENNEVYRKAKKRVKAKIGFYSHLITYIAVNAMLVAINLLTYPEYLWFRWPLLGWGVGVFLHAMSVFFFSGKSAFKERMIAKEISRETQRNQ